MILYFPFALQPIPLDFPKKEKAKDGAEKLKEVDKKEKKGKANAGNQSIN